MASADFWPITTRVAACRASANALGFGGGSSPFRLGLSPTSMAVPDAPFGQISPDKDVNCRCTTAAFTLSTEPGALLCCANLPADWALYAVSVRRLTALHSGFLQTGPRGAALAVG
jgi:hypothetical protein